MDEYGLELILDEDTEELINFEIPIIENYNNDDDIEYLTEEELLLLFNTTESL